MKLKEISIFLFTMLCVFVMFSAIIDTVYAYSQVQVNASLPTEKTQVLNTSGATIAAYQAVVMDVDDTVTKSQLCVNTTTTADDPAFIGYTDVAIGTGEIGFIITRGIATAEANGTVTAGAAIGTATDAGEVDAGSYAGFALETGTDENILVFIP